jgi:hypothetical protein
MSGALTQAASVEALASASAAAFAAFLFARAALHKAWDFTAFTGFVQDYDLLPAALVRLASALLLAAEIAVVAAMLIPGARLPGLVRGAAILLGYALAMGINVARGRRYVECGCGGAVQPITPALLIRNAVLAAVLLAGAAMVPGALAWTEAVAAIAAALIAFAGYVMAEQILSNAAYLLRREQGNTQ